MRPFRTKFSCPPRTKISFPKFPILSNVSGFSRQFSRPPSNYHPPFFEQYPEIRRCSGLLTNPFELPIFGSFTMSCRKPRSSLRWFQILLNLLLNCLFFSRRRPPAAHTIPRVEVFSLFTSSKSSSSSSFTFFHEPTFLSTVVLTARFSLSLTPALFRFVVRTMFHSWPVRGLKVKEEPFFLA